MAGMLLLDERAHSALARLQTLMVGGEALPVALAQQLQPDVAVLDISMPGHGLDATRKIRSTCSGTRVLILTFHAQEYFLCLAIRAGATGYVLKSTVDTELLNAIRMVAEGGAFLYPSGAKMLVEDYARFEADMAHADSQLSEREREVIRLIALGYTAGEAAEVLKLSPKTVETHRMNVMRKLKLSTAPELLRFALQYVETDGNPPRQEAMP